MPSQLKQNLINFTETIVNQNIVIYEDVWPYAMGAIIFLIIHTGIHPLQTHHAMTQLEAATTYLRKALLIASILILGWPFLTYLSYAAAIKLGSDGGINQITEWLVSHAKQQTDILLSAITIGFITKILLSRYGVFVTSKLEKKLRKQQSNETITDIKNEIEERKKKEFNPKDYYKEGYVFIGLNHEDNPIYMPKETFNETNCQVVGSTRYGKGISLGVMMDQCIKANDSVFYIDIKKDRFAPQIMYQAAKAAGKKFYYVTLHDKGIGKWSPFEGGDATEAFSRFKSAMNIDLTGDPATDYYKSKEATISKNAFKKTKKIKKLLNMLGNHEDSRVVSELEQWAEIESLCPEKGGFSIEKALLENAVVYVQGDLYDKTLLTATKTFLMELIQETRRLDEKRESHVTMVVDEVSFLTSKILANALATIVGFNANFVLAYQSPSDLENVDDTTTRPEYVLNSININCQIKLYFGGADSDTAQKISEGSGTTVKKLAKFEKTEITRFGGEKWEDGRMLADSEEPLIHKNTILTLPKTVCAIIQPGQLAEICYTSFIQIEENPSLTEYLETKEKEYSNAKESSENSQMKNSKQKKQQTKRNKTTNANPFIENTPKKDMPDLKESIESTIKSKLLNAKSDNEILKSVKKIDEE